MPLIPQGGDWDWYRFGGGKTTASTTVSGLGDNTVVNPPANQAITLLWVGLSSSAQNAIETVATVKLGGVAVYSWNMTLPGAFAHWEPVVGPVNGVLALNLTNAQPVIFNYTYTTA